MKCAGPVAEGCSAALLDVLWLAWMEASVGAPAIAAAADDWIKTAVAEDGPVLRVVTLAKDLLKQQLVRSASSLASRAAGSRRGRGRGRPHRQRGALTRQGWSRFCGKAAALQSWAK